MSPISHFWLHAPSVKVLADMSATVITDMRQTGKSSLLQRENTKKKYVEKILK